MDLPLFLSAYGSRGAALVDALREAILSGRLAAGARLPPSRALAAQLSLARGTVVTAYEELVAQGYCYARVGAGTYVAVTSPVRRPPPPAAPLRLSGWGERLRADRFVIAAQPSPTFDFRHGVAPEGLPGRALLRALRRSADQLGVRPDAGDPAGSLRLRTALALHLAQARGLHASPEQLIIVSGSQQGLDLAARLLLDSGDRVAFEEPGYPRARRVLAAVGAVLAPVAVDDGGLCPEALPSGGARMVYVTPSHQFPTGAVLAPERRFALLRWAEANDAWVLEDDYDSEFRYGGPPLPCLQGMDRGGRCLYVGSMSKLLHPALRLGYLVVPPSLVEVAIRAKSTLDQATTPLIQEALADLFEDREIELHLRRTTRAYRARRARLLAALTASLPRTARVWPITGGLHAFVQLPDVQPEALHRQARRRGVALTDALDCYTTPPRGTPLILWFSRIAASLIGPGIAALCDSYIAARTHTSAAADSA